MAGLKVKNYQTKQKLTMKNKTTITDSPSHCANIMLAAGRLFKTILKPFISVRDWRSLILDYLRDCLYFLSAVAEPLLIGGLLGYFGPRLIRFLIQLP